MLQQSRENKHRCGNMNYMVQSHLNVRVVSTTKSWSADKLHTFVVRAEDVLSFMWLTVL